MKLVVWLNQHNSGFGSNQTSDPCLHPWALLAFVCSFGGEHHLLCQFERDWQAKQNRMLSSGDVCTPADIADLGCVVISDWQWDEIAMGLRYVSMGHFPRHTIVQTYKTFINYSYYRSSVLDAMIKWR